MEKYYLDTAIWRDYYEDRKDKAKNLGKYAFELLCKILASKSKIVVSYIVLRELESVYSVEMIKGLFRPFEKHIVRMDISEDQIKEANHIAEDRDVPRGDALHAILARDCGAVLVTRDRHFEKLRDVCLSVLPEGLI